jgi:hypothetical protein
MEEGIDSDFRARETRKSIADAVRFDLEKNLFYGGDLEVDARVRIETLEYRNDPWGLLWLPLVVVGLPMGRLRGAAAITMELRSPQGELIGQYRSEKTETAWYNNVYYNRLSTLSHEGGITREALKLAVEEVKHAVIRDRYRIAAILKGEHKAPAAPGIAESVVPYSDVDLNIPKTAMENPDAVAVVFGISDYLSPDVPDVEYARQDAGVVRQYLANVLGYDEKNILPRDPAQLMTAGTMKTIVRQQLPAHLKRGISEVFVYYSGHGAPNVASRKGYLVPADCDPNFVNDDNAYSLEEFCRDLTQLECSRLIVAIDACFSGLSAQGDMLIRGASPLFVTIEHPILRQEHVVWFSSAQPDQTSNWCPEKKHGLFTYFFLKGLQGGADRDGNGELTVSELEDFLTDQGEGVPYWARREHQRIQLPVVLSRDKEQVLVKY